MAHRDDLNQDDRGSQARRSMESQEEFFRRYWPRLVRVLSSQASNSSVAEDVAADTFLAAMSDWDKLLTYDRPDSWLFKVAIRKLRRLEEKARSRDSLAEDPASIRADLRRASLDDDWTARNLDLLAALRVMPRRQAEVVTLRRLEGFSVKETAEILGVEEDTVTKQLSRAMAKLRVLLHVNPGPDPDMAERNPS
jgi:RNA polymerase sigma factor (sigma-70 family)